MFRQLSENNNFHFIFFYLFGIYEYNNGKLKFKTIQFLVAKEEIWKIE